MDIELLIPADWNFSRSGYTIDKPVIGRLNTSIFYLSGTGKPGLYLKTGKATAALDLSVEHSRLLWLEEKLPVPRVLQFTLSGGTATVLLSEIVGVPAHLSQLPTRRKIELLAEGLRKIHGLRIDECPFQNTLEQELMAAERKIRDGTLNLPTFLEGTSGRSPQTVLDELIAKRSIVRNLVFTHGDYCLPNVIFDGDGISGFVDWGIAGVADIHRDLMAVADSISMNCGSQWVEEFYQAYNQAEVDPERIRYYKLLDRFFSY